MDLDSHINLIESQNRKLFGSSHFLILCIIFSVIVATLLFYTEPLIAFGASGFIAFVLHYFYAQLAFKKLNARITLLQTKIEQSST